MWTNRLIPDFVYPQFGDWDNTVSYAITVCERNTHIPVLSSPRAVSQTEAPHRHFGGNKCECYGDVTQVEVKYSLGILTRSHRDGHLL
jgi:hypothetical protein